MHRKRRRTEIRLKKKKAEKIKELKEGYLSARSGEEKSKIRKKFSKIVPYLNFENYLKAI